MVASEKRKAFGPKHVDVSIFAAFEEVHIWNYTTANSNRLVIFGLVSSAVIRGNENYHIETENMLRF
jgi:hypothetical protein